MQSVEFKEKYKSVLIQKYGVDNNFKREDVKAVIRENLYSQSTEAIKKKKETRIKNGFQIPDSMLTDYEKYRRDIDRLTRKVWTHNKQSIQNYNKERGRKLHHIDHCYSVFDGFFNEISIDIISHPANLRMISASENCSKRNKSIITLEELLRRIETWNTDFVTA